MEEIKARLSELTNRAHAFQSRAKKVSEVCQQIGRSWSGSSFVGHAKYFFGNFEEPSAPERFSVEWGLIHGVPRGWIERSDEEVRAKIENDSGVSLDEMKQLAIDLQNGFQDVQREAVLLLAEQHAAEGDIEKIETFTIKTATEIFKSIFPTKYITRDTESASAYYYAPHIYYDAVARFIDRYPEEIKGFSFELEKIARRPASKAGASDGKSTYYVEGQLILRLSSLKSEKYDLTKLVQMCKELNDNYSLGNYLACGMLIRAILDHVPPIFGKTTFAEVANNYGTKSFKDIVLPLQETARKISDSYLHVPIRKKELLPGKTQVSFQPNMDYLLSEVIRILQS